MESNTARGLPLHVKILIGLVIGATLGIAANMLASHSAPTAARVAWLAENVIEPLGRVFLRLVIMVVVPLVVSALILGILELGDIRNLGRVGSHTLMYTVVMSLASVCIGVGLVNLLRPGSSLPEEKRIQLREKYEAKAAEAVAKSAAAKKLRDTLLDMLPENPLQEMVGALDGSSKGNGMLAVMFFSLIVGVALTITRERTGPLIGVIEGLFDVSMTIIGFAMKLAPLGVGCLIFSVTATIGFEILHILLWFVATVVLGLAIQMFVVYSLMLMFVARVSPKRFFVSAREAILTAFGTSSSNATLPTALRVAKENLKLRADVSQFVLTVGSTANQNGTALFEGVVVLFLAQVFVPEPLSLTQQVIVVLMSILAGIGTAGVPGGSIPMIVIVMKQVGVPADGIAIILGVDRILDMCRTTLNVTGDLVLATCVSNTSPSENTLHVK